MQFSTSYIHLTWAADGNAIDAVENHYIAECKLRQGFESEPEIRLLRHMGCGPDTRVLCLETAEKANNEQWSRAQLLRFCDAEIERRHTESRKHPRNEDPMKDQHRKKWQAGTPVKELHWPPHSEEREAKLLDEATPKKSGPTELHEDINQAIKEEGK